MLSLAHSLPAVCFCVFARAQVGQTRRAQGWFGRLDPAGGDGTSLLALLVLVCIDASSTLRVMRCESRFFWLSALPFLALLLRWLIALLVYACAEGVFTAGCPRQPLTCRNARARGTAATDPDTDGDGLPDAWETAHGTDPNDSGDAGIILPSNYTAAETYAQERHNALLAGEMAKQAAQAARDKAGVVHLYLADTFQAQQQGHSPRSETWQQGFGGVRGVGLHPPYTRVDIQPRFASMFAAFALPACLILLVLPEAVLARLLCAPARLEFVTACASSRSAC